MAALIGEWIASVETIVAVSRHNPQCLLVYREDGRVTGVVSFLLLRPAGLLSIATDTFDGVAPDIDMLTSPEETPLAGYGWALAAKTRKAAAAVLAGLGRVRTDLYPGIPFFARAATNDGRRVLCGRLRYLPFPRSNTGLLWSPPIHQEGEEAPL
ncbi:MAG: hypothetical protein ABIO39_15290 [Caulobacteraceae bacterium]